MCSAFIVKCFVLHNAKYYNILKKALPYNEKLVVFIHPLLNIGVFIKSIYKKLWFRLDTSYDRLETHVDWSGLFSHLRVTFKLFDLWTNKLCHVLVSRQTIWTN